MGESKLYRIRRVHAHRPPNPQTAGRRMRAHGLVHHTYHTFFFLPFFFDRAKAMIKQVRLEGKHPLRGQSVNGEGVFCQGTRRRSLSNNLLPFKGKQKRHQCACVCARGQLLYCIPMRMSQQCSASVEDLCCNPIQEPFFKLLLVVSGSLYILANFWQTSTTSINLIYSPGFHFCQMANSSVPTESCL